ncbi:MAG: alpha/beta fold hydrolase [Thermoanaerobaculia bacterium]
MKLQFDSEGDGPLVVLLHGFPESRKTWTRQLPALAAAGFRAVAPDLRGYGDSPKPRGIKPYRMSEIAADVAELIESLHGAPCAVVGHDWGAAAAWTLAMERPELLRQLVILNVPHPSAIAREARRSLRQKLNLSYQVFFQLPVLPELVMKVLTRQWRRDFTPMLNYYRALRYPRTPTRFIETPTLIIWGEGEPVFLASGLENLDKWIRDVRIERIANAGHFVQRDAAERVNELLIDSLLSSRA